MVVTRDVGFYTISLIILFWALSDRRAVDDDNGKFVYISKYHAGALVGCYVIYVIICANFSRWFRPADTQTEHEHYEAFEVSMPQNEGSDRHLKKILDTMPFVREPTENFHVCEDDFLDMVPPQTLLSASSVLTELYSKSDNESFDKESSRSETSYIESASFFLLDKSEPRLHEIKGIADIERKDQYCQFYLWQQSSFYDKAKIDIHAWELRWFTFSHNRIVSLPNRRSVTDEEDGVFMLPVITCCDVDRSRLLIKIKTSGRDYVFLAPTDAIFSVAVRRFEEFLHLPVLELRYSEDSIETPEQHSSLLTYPHHGSILEKIFHIILLPIKAMIQLGIPDVRQASAAPTLKATVSMILSVTYLIGGSYVLVETLENVAKELDIPESVVGATVSAAGTSLPNYIASQMAARQGLGNMAIANVFGSNTFNISIALGLPWLVYSCINEGEYSDLSDEGINEAMYSMAFALVVFIILITCSKFHLRLWHAYYFYALYALFLVHIIGHCFI